MPSSSFQSNIIYSLRDNYSYQRENENSTILNVNIDDARRESLLSFVQITNIQYMYNIMTGIKFERIFRKT